MKKLHTINLLLGVSLCVISIFTRDWMNFAFGALFIISAQLQAIIEK